MKPLLSNILSNSTHSVIFAGVPVVLEHLWIWTPGPNPLADMAPLRGFGPLQMYILGAKVSFQDTVIFIGAL